MGDAESGPVNSGFPGFHVRGQRRYYVCNRILLSLVHWQWGKVSYSSQAVLVLSLSKDLDGRWGRSYVHRQ